LLQQRPIAPVNGIFCGSPKTLTGVSAAKSSARNTQQTWGTVPRQGNQTMTRKAMVCAAMCLCVSGGADAFAPMALTGVGRRGASPVLRPRGGAQQRFLCPAVPNGVQTAAAGVSRTVLGMDKTQLVTYGDMWRDALHENENGEQTGELPTTDATSAEGDDFTYATEELSILASEVVAPIKAAATVVASAVWNRLSRPDDDEEIQRNMKAFAKSHSGAVMTPLGDDELASEVRYLGMFPDLVDALLEAQENADTKQQEQEDIASAALAGTEVE